MIRKVLILLCLISIMVRAQDISWVNGTWEGIGYQASVNSSWTIRFEAMIRTNSFSIAYPSLGCGGNWSLSSIDANKIEFFETITYGKTQCVEGGTIVVTRVDGQYVTFTYFLPGTRTLDAFSTLKRVK
ncbi:hypothetical protein HUU42_07825 [bacterium]|nr:hypothetical protein [bacterium]